MGETITNPDPALAEEQMRGLDPAAQVGVAESEIPATAIRDVDLAHDMALTGDDERSSAASTRAIGDLRAKAIAEEEEIRKGEPLHERPSYNEEKAAYEERLRNFYIGIGRQSEDIKHTRLGERYKQNPDGKNEDDLAQSGKHLADAYYYDPREVEDKSKRYDKIAERQEDVVKILHDHPELVTLDGKPMSPEDFESATNCWATIDQIEGVARFEEQSSENIQAQLDNLFRALRQFPGNDLATPAEAVDKVLELARNNNTTVGEIRTAAAKVVRSLKSYFEQPYGPRIKLISHETLQT